MDEIAVLIVDDHEVVRQGLRAVLQKESSIHVVADVASGEDACALVAALGPAVVIMDLSMPGMNGTEATARILAISPESRVIVLTAHEEMPYVSELLRAGARGYVLKRAVLTHLLQAIRVVAAGGTFVDPELTNRVRPADADVTVLQSAAELSAREVEVASLAARGHSNGEIAATLQISTKTVETHKARLMAKLGLKTRAQLVRYAMYRAWI